MKIALIISSLTIKGGGQRQILELASNLQKENREAIIFTGDFNPENCYPDLCKNLSIKSLSENGRKTLNEIPGFPLKTQIIDLMNILKMGYMVYQYNPDILNPHEWPANWIACLAKLFRKKNLKVVWMCNDLWHQDNPYQKNRPLTGLFFPTRLLDRFITKYFVDQIVVLDNRMKFLVRKFYKRKAIVIRSGLDIKKFASFKPQKAVIRAVKQKLGVNRNEFFLLSLSVFFPQRRFEDVIWAIKKIVNGHKAVFPLKYIIIGSKEADLNYYKYIKSLIKVNKLEKIIKIAAKPLHEKELLNYYSACDVFIFPNDKQTWGLAPIEAMALGKPCLISKGAGVHEVLTDRVNAMLVKPRDPQETASKLMELVRDPQLRTKIGQNGKKLALSNFSWEKYTSDMIKIINSNLKK